MNQLLVKNLSALPKCSNEEQCLVLFSAVVNLDEIKRFFAFPFSIISFILNIGSLLVYLSKDFDNRIYQYFRIYCINSAILSIFDAFFYFSTRKYGDIQNNLIVLSILNYGYYFVQSLLSCFIGYLDCLILFERVSQITNKFRSLKKISVNLICLLVFMVCCIICTPTFFYYQIRSGYALINSTYIFQFNGLMQTNFYLGTTGNIISYIHYFFKDFTIFTIEIVLNTISVIFLKKHMMKKKQLMNIKNSSSIGNELVPNLNNKGLIKINADTRLTILATIMCSFSLLQHFGTLSFGIYSRIDLNNFSKNLLFYYVFIYTLKNFLNFFLFYFFNKIFRQKLHSVFKNVG